MHVGTSGYSYPEWKGSFYPEKLPAKAMLGYYAERFQTVEINNTFYRMPTEAMLKGWGDQVPEGFAFALKASRRITHDRRLQDVGEATAFLFQAGAVLGQKLGPFLFQLPPFLKKDLATLKTFLALLPPGARAALEFRHATWLDDEVYEALRAAGAALCVADAGEPVDAPLLATADWGYLRLRRPDYGSDDLKSWAERIQTQPWQDCFVYFKHEEEGKGPQLATEFMKWIG
ncbi:MAG TPA: DUF72 domain-containing protein [Candidatus Limnocylindria bacterium]|nr:DUF72 domain-containing protein [Candidatus Limnocylindria bacterium]